MDNIKYSIILNKSVKIKLKIGLILLLTYLKLIDQHFIGGLMNIINNLLIIKIFMILNF